MERIVSRLGLVAHSAPALPLASEAWIPGSAARPRNDERVELRGNGGRLRLSQTIPKFRHSGAAKPNPESMPQWRKVWNLNHNGSPLKTERHSASPQISTIEAWIPGSAARTRNDEAWGMPAA
jgi:hypothetical protein